MDMDEMMASLLAGALIHVDETGEEMTLAELLEAYEGITRPTPPPYGSPQYRETITHVTEHDELEGVIGAVDALYDDYGWRGPLDLMTAWVQQMDRSPQMHHGYRDMTGAVDVTQFVVVHVDEEKELRIASDRAQRYAQRGLPQHEAFQKGLKDTRTGLELAQYWHPYFRSAFAAAHATGASRLVRAELFKAPARKDRKALCEGAVLLGTIAYGARHQEEMYDRYQQVGKGREALSHPAISPGWDVGGYLSRDAMKR